MTQPRKDFKHAREGSSATLRIISAAAFQLGRERIVPKTPCSFLENQNCLAVVLPSATVQNRHGLRGHATVNEFVLYSVDFRKSLHP